MIAAAVLLSLFVGWAALASAMPRHGRQIWGHDASRPARVALRLVGSALLILAAALCMRDWGWPIGSVFWFGAATASAIAVILLLPYLPKR